MKKKVLAVVSACMLVLLTACGGADNKTDGDSKSDVKVNADANVDTEQDAPEDAEKGDKQDNAADVEPEIEEPVVYTAKQEILDAEWHSGLVQVNDKLIQLPLQLSELLAMGFDYVVDDGDKSKDYLFANKEKISYDLFLDGKEVCTQIYLYTGDELTTLEEINPTVEYISFSGIKETELAFFLPGGLTLGDTMQALEEKLGEPLEMNTSSTSFSYIYGRPSKGSSECEIGLSVAVNRDSQLVTGFRFAKNIALCTFDEFSPVTIENVKNLQSEDNHAVQVYFSEDYLIADNNVRTDSCETVFEKDGALYCLRLHFSATLQKYFNQYDLNRAGTLLYDDTDENGVNRKVYDSGTIYCFKDPFVMKVTASVTPLSKTEANLAEFYQEYIVNLGKTIQY